MCKPMRVAKPLQKALKEVSKGYGAYLVSFEALDSLLLLLLSEDDEGSTVFVECETHVSTRTKGSAKSKLVLSR